MTEFIACPYCSSSASTPWDSERGFTAVKCTDCGIIYVNPRPRRDRINETTRTGAHSNELNVVSRRTPSRVRHYRKLLGRLFFDVWERGTPITWLDVGAGYGEVIEAVTSLAPRGSIIRGLEPMRPKVDAARARGLSVSEGYLCPSQGKVDFVSVINVFSHIPQFDEFLGEVRATLNPGGEILIETGNVADLKNRDELPDELYLPDHLVFAGESHILGYLNRSGFSVIKVEKAPIDGITFFIKTAIKKAIGRPVKVRPPYTSGFRTMLVRARAA